jgi:hypothetical protein
MRGVSGSFYRFRRFLISSVLAWLSSASRCVPHGLEDDERAEHGSDDRERCEWH